MNIFVNQMPHSLPAGATLVDAIALTQVQMPFAVAVNLQFVPQSVHAAHHLAEGDRIDIISPVSGG